MGLWEWLSRLWTPKEDPRATLKAPPSIFTPSSPADTAEIARLKDDILTINMSANELLDEVVIHFVKTIDELDPIDIETDIRTFMVKYRKPIQRMMPYYKGKFDIPMTEERVIIGKLIIASLEAHCMHVFKILVKEEPFTNPDYKSFKLFDALAKSNDYEATLIVFDPLKKIIFESIYYYVFDEFVESCITFRSAECILALNDNFPNVCKRHKLKLIKHDLLDTF
jgi:hypothetical protein